MASGPEAVAKWVLKRAYAEFKKRKLALCAGSDKVYAKLKAAGAAGPSAAKWKSLSCDQKMAFMLALGPAGMQMMIVGGLLGGFATNAAREMEKYAPAAAAKIGDTVTHWTKVGGGIFKVPKIRL